MAVYWGQGPSQQRLAHFCADSSIDIIPIAFLNIFPDQVNRGYPGTNFGNQCGSETYKNKDGSSSPLLSNCPFIGPDIKTCQAMGKKILLSLGGAIPTNQSIKDDNSAKSFAKFLWNAFGPVDPTYDGPRPFGDAVVDGFDFDIESAVSDNDATTQYRGYGTMIDTLRIYFAADIQKQYYISGAPQCVIPDAHLAHPIETSWFDFLFIQFYNTPQCSARAYFDASYGAQGDQPSVISFDAWVDFIRMKAMNKDVKLYIGLPAAPLTQLVYDTKMYIAPDDVINLVEVYQCRYPQEFGGIMVFEATYSEQNLIDNKPFADVIKGQMTDCGCAQKPKTSSTSSSTSTTSSSVASSTIASSTVATSSPTSSSSARASASASLPSYPSSTGLWNSTSTPGPSAPIGTGSSSMAYPSSTGIWNSTVVSSSSTPIGTGSSSIPPYPTGTGIWNSTYVPGPTAPLSSGTGHQSSSVPVNKSTSASSYVSTSSQYATGASSGFPSSTPLISVPYPVTNVTVTPSTRPSGGIIYTTETITVTSCPPEVTSCPVRTSVTTYPITTSSSVPVTTVPTNSPETTTSGSGSLTTSHVPVSTIPTAPGLTTTKIVTSYVTTCSVTSTATVHGSTSVYTSSTVSTVYTTIVSTVPVSPVPTTTSGYSSLTTSHALVSTIPAALGVTTTKLVTSYVTTCPVTGTTTVHGSTSVYTSSTVSTVHTTIISTIPVFPAPTSGTPLTGPGQGSQPGPAPSHGGSSSSASPPSNSGSSPLGSGSHPAPQPEQPAHGSSSNPAHGGSSPSSGHGNSPIGAGNSPSSSSGSNSPHSSSYGSSSSSSGNSPSQPQQPSAPALGATSPSSSPGAGNSPVQSNGTVPSQPQGPAAPGLSTTLQTATRQITASLQTNPAGNPAPGVNSSASQSTSSLPEIVTQTIVPVPLYPSQTAHPAGGSASTSGLSPVQAAPVPSAPFPAGNGTAVAGQKPTGSAAPSASVSGPAGGVVPFTGAAGRVGSSVVGLMLGIVVAAAMVVM
ncbi:MAG: hypothetical protein Q9225_000957 [Loekoesia sp. 1 TL-2023]